MQQLEKLRVLLPHWIEHNVGHGAECRKWADIAREEGQHDIAQHIDAALLAMLKVNEHLAAALAASGGAAHADDEAHHHHH